MKNVISHSNRIRSVVLMAVIAVMVVVCGVVAVTPQQQMTAEAAPLWKYYFGSKGGYNGGTQSTHASANGVTLDHTTYKNQVGITSTGTTTDTFFYAQNSTLSTSINANTSKVMVLRYWTEDTDLSFQIFGFKSASSFVASFSRVVLGNGQWHDLIVDMTTAAKPVGNESNTTWDGTITGLRIDMNNFQKDSKVYIAFVAFFDTVANAEAWANGKITYVAGSSGTTTIPEKHTGQVGTSTSTAETKVIKWGSSNPMSDSSSGGTPGFYVMTNSSRPTNNTGSTFLYWTLWIYEKVPNSTSQTYKFVSGIGSGTAKTWTLGTNQIGLIYTGGGNVVTTAIGQGSYVKFSSAANGATITVYTGYTAPSTTTTSVEEVLAPTATPATPSYIKGTISVTGGTLGSYYTGATSSTRTFYRSDVSNYMYISAGATSMDFNYTGVQKMQLSDVYSGSTSTGETQGVAVGKIVIKHANQSDGSIPDDSDGAIQWSYIPNGGDGKVNFQDPNTVTFGTYYDQNVGYDGYQPDDYVGTGNATASNQIVYKGTDRYVYSGNFSNNVLPASTYIAELEYDILYQKYVVCTVQNVVSSGDTQDGANVRMWPNIGENTSGNENGILTSLPLGTTVYVGYTDNYPDFEYRICTAVVNGIYYEG